MKTTDRSAKFPPFFKGSSHQPKNGGTVHIQLKPIVGALEFEQLQLPPIVNHWGPHIRAAEFGVIISQKGAPVRRFAIAVAISMATKTEFLGNSPSGKRHVVFITATRDAHALQRILSTTAKSLQTELGNNLKFIAPFLYGGQIPSPTSVDGQWELDQAIGNVCDVIFVEYSWPILNNGKEDVAAGKRFVTWLMKLKREGKTVVLVCTSRRVGEPSTPADGYSPFDFVLALKPPKEKAAEADVSLVVEWKKSPCQSPGKTKPFLATCRKDASGQRSWSRSEVSELDARRREAKKMVADGASLSAVASKFCVHKSTISRWVGGVD